MKLADGIDAFIISLWSSLSTESRDKIRGLTVIAVIIIVFSAISVLSDRLPHR
jgi:hypothetical protein